MRDQRIEDIYKLSPIQQGILFHSLYTPSSDVYFEQFSWSSSADLDITAFTQAWQTAVDRHPILRTAFFWEDLDKPLQMVKRQVALPLERYDWCALSAEEQSARLAALLVEDRRRRFELNAAPLMRLSLVKLREATYQVIWSYHHLLLDGWSLRLLLEDVFRCYEAYCRGEVPHLPQRRPYRDYITWLRQQNLDAAEAFWRQTLRGFSAPTQLGIALAAGHEEAQDDDYKVQRAEFTAAMTQALEILARQHHLTLNTLFQGAWGVLLSCYSGEEEVIFGATVSGRPPDLPGSEAMIGLFINTLPVRVRVAPDVPLLDWLHSLQTQQIKLRQYQYSPLVEIQRWSDIPRGTPIFESIVVFENFPLNMLHGTHTAVTFQRTNYPLMLVVEPGPPLTLRIGYECRRFDTDTIVRMLEHLQVVLQSILASPKQRLAEVSLLSATERRQLDSWNATHAAHPHDRCVHHLFEAQVAQAPDAIALICNGGRVSYHELNVRANQLARYLQALDVGQGVPIGLYLDRSIEFVIGLLGILKAGGAYIPLDPSSPHERLDFLLKDTQTPVLLTRRRMVAGLPAYAGQVVCLDTDWPIIARAGATSLANHVRADQLAYLIYTSGSTGRPKAVMVEHRNLVNVLYAAQQQFAFQPRDVMPWLASVAFDITLFELMCPLLSGGAVVVLEQQHILDLPRLFTELISCTVFHAVPSLMRQITQVIIAEGLERSLYDHIRLVFVGGDVVPPELLKELHAVFERAEIAVLYGPTEATIICTRYMVPRSRSISGHPIGTPLHNMQVRLYGLHHQLMPVGVCGELYVGGAGVTRGYLHQEALTDERYVVIEGQRWYRTGDLARYLSDGTIEFLGRVDQQVKVRGYRIEPGEVETVLRQHVAVREAVVVAHADVLGEQRLVAYLVTSDELQVTSSEDSSLVTRHLSLLSELRAFLRERLPDYMVPAVFVLLDALPLLPNGKVDRRALPVPDSRQSLDHAYVAPRTAVEEQLAQIWTDVLRLERVGIHDNFFALGGDSILSIQIIARAKQGGLHLTPRQIFQHQTIAELAAVASIVSADIGPQELAAGVVPLTPIQRWFLEQDLPDPQHFNQALLLEVRQPLSLTLVERALYHLQMQHDALRLRFMHTESGWQQHSADAVHQPIVIKVDLRVLSKADQKRAITAIATELHLTLDLVNGPLLRSALFDLGFDEPARLLLIIHHLAVDAVSWTILLEDLQTIYGQYRQGQAVQLPPKTMSFKGWAERLVTYAQSDVLHAERSYWLAQARQQVPRLPVDYSTATNTVATTRKVTVTLDVEETRALLYKVPPIYHMQVNEVLLAALAQACVQWTGRRVLLVDVEGHGREDLFDDVDLTRTVGWHTTVFPLLLDLRQGDAPGAALKAVKEQLRQVPHRGIGYGVLRYLSEDEELVQALCRLPSAEVRFNYLGQLGQMAPLNGLFVPACESIGLAQSLRSTRPYLLEINCGIAGEQLYVEWTYSEEVHRHTTIEWLAQVYLVVLRALIAHCLLPIAGGYTPSDFPEAKLSQEELDRAMSTISRKGRR